MKDSWTCNQTKFILNFYIIIYTSNNSARVYHHNLVCTCIVLIGVAICSVYDFRNWYHGTLAAFSKVAIMALILGLHIPCNMGIQYKTPQILSILQMQILCLTTITNMDLNIYSIVNYCMMTRLLH